MMKAFSIRFIQLFKYLKKDLKMIVLFIGHDIDHLLCTMVYPSLVCCPEVLCHVNRSTVISE